MQMSGSPEADFIGSGNSLCSRNKTLEVALGTTAVALQTSIKTAADGRQTGHSHLFFRLGYISLHQFFAGIGYIIGDDTGSKS
jgi:hypothetical protein